MLSVSRPDAGQCEFSLTRKCPSLCIDLCMEQRTDTKYDALENVFCRTKLPGAESRSRRCLFAVSLALKLQQERQFPNPNFSEPFVWILLVVKPCSLVSWEC